MIEAAMILALGALVASLLWLLVLPVVSRRAVRLASARLARQVPVSMAEVGAERDGLRAAHAVEVRRLEQAVESATARTAGVRSENGRHVARIVELEALERGLIGEIARLQEALASAIDSARTAEATLGAQAVVLHEALGLADRRAEQMRASEARLAADRAQIDERRATIAALETRTAGQDLKLQAALAQVARLADDLAAARASMDDATGARDVARADLHLAAAQKAVVQERFEALMAETERLRSEIDTGRQNAARGEKRLRLQGQTIDGLADRIMAQDTELTRLRRLVKEPDDRRAPDPTQPDDRGQRLRAAIASLGADLVAFATTSGPAETEPDRATP